MINLANEEKRERGKNENSIDFVISSFFSLALQALFIFTTIEFHFISLLLLVLSRPTTGFDDYIPSESNRLSKVEI